MLPTLARWALSALFATTLAACGGGGNDDTPTPPVTPPVVTPTASLAIAPAALTIVAGTNSSSIVTLTRGGGFAGAVSIAASGAPSGVTVTAPAIAASGTTSTVTVVVAATTAAGTSTVTLTGSGTGVTIAPVTLALTVQAAPAGVTELGSGIIGEAAGDQSGTALALSADGSRIAIAAPLNDGAGGADSGHVRVYQKSGSTWTQLGGDIDGESAEERSGVSVGMSADGSRVVIGAYLNGGSVPRSGAGQVRVYELVAGAWVQVGTDINGGTGSGLGYAVAISADGRRIIAGAPGINSGVGYAQVYEQTGNNWVQLGATLAVTGSSSFGQALDMSDDGNRVAIGAPGAEISTRPGTVYVYAWNGTAWAPLGAPIAGEHLADVAGTSVSLSSDGSRLAIGAPSNKDGGVSGGGSPAGQVRVYAFDGTAWAQLGGDVDGKVALNGDAFGSTVALSGDGTRFVASGPDNGAARVFTLTAGAWLQTGVDLTGARTNGVAMAADGKTAAVGYIYFQPGAIGKTQVYTVTP